MQIFILHNGQQITVGEKLYSTHNVFSQDKR